MSSQRQRPFFKVYRDRNGIMDELQSKPMAMALLIVVARRAVRVVDGFNPHGLHIGQCLIGDYAAYGMSRRQYQTAQKHLEDLGLCRFEGHRGKGTVATLEGDQVVDINPMQADAGGQYLFDFGDNSTNDCGTISRKSQVLEETGLRARQPGRRDHLRDHSRAHSRDISPPKNKETKEIKEEQQSAPAPTAVVDVLSNLGMSAAAAGELVAEHGEPDVLEMAQQVASRIMAGEAIGNPPGYLVAALQKKTRGGVPLVERRAEEAEQRQQARQQAQHRASAQRAAEEAEARRRVQEEEALVDQYLEDPELRHGFEERMQDDTTLLGSCWRDSGWDAPVIRGAFLEYVTTQNMEMR